MEFRILGPLEVVRDGKPLVMGAAKPRALLGSWAWYEELGMENWAKRAVALADGQSESSTRSIF